MQIKEQVRTIVSNIIEGAAQLDDESLLKGVGLNSINFIQMIVELEDEFNIEFDEDELDDYETISIQSLVDYIEKKL